MQTDPIGYADGMNWYDYVGGDPVNAVDPSGLCTITNYTKWHVWPSEGRWEKVDSWAETSGCDTNPALEQSYSDGRTIVVSGRRRGHDYTVYSTICPFPLKESQMRNLLARFSLPGDSGRKIESGFHLVWRYSIPNLVSVDFSSDGLEVTNTTVDKLHFLRGQIVRRIYADRFGTFMTTRGTGDASDAPLGSLRDWFNDREGPEIFGGLDDDAIEYARSSFGC